MEIFCESVLIERKNPRYPTDSSGIPDNRKELPI